MPGDAVWDTYYRARNTGRRMQIWSALTRRPRRLLALKELDAGYTPRPNRRGAAVRTVPIARIRGSEEFLPARKEAASNRKSP